jgi:ketosteroid isomerase-like protein
MAHPADIAREVFACYVLGDTAGMLELVHPDAPFRFPGDPAVLPWAGQYVGAEMARFHDAIKDSLDLLEFTVQRYEPKDDTVIAFAHERCRVKLTGKVFENDLVGIMTIRDGKVARYLEYSDTATMQAAFLD